MQFVVQVLRHVFAYPLEQCIRLMLEAHLRGRAIVWTGPLEIAELKAEQIRSFGPDPQQHERTAQPLQVSVEPLA
jgi:ATP-dependent Clp protease adaptor protein ClpS